MFLIDSEAITVLWVFSMAEEMTKASGSSSRAASRTGTMCRSLSSTAMRSNLASVFRSISCTCFFLYSAGRAVYLKFS